MVLVGRRSRGAWMPAAVPPIRVAQVAAWRAEAARAADLASRFVDQSRHFTSQAAVLERYARWLEIADLYWVTADMAAAALDASLDVPGIVTSEAPDQGGLMTFDKPLPGYNTPGGLALRDESGDRLRIVEYTDPVPVDALAWLPTGDSLRISILTRTERLPLPLTHTPSPLTEIAGVTIPDGPGFLFDDATRMDNQAAPGTAISAAQLGPVALLSAAWALMFLPTVAERRTVDPTGKTPPGQPVPRDREVTTIDLRPLRHVREPGGSTTSRQYQHRWIVRGHWTNQAHGPERSLRKLIWISSYIKGPDDAPLKVTEKVAVWRRN